MTEFLIPPHLSAKRATVDAVSRTFQVSTQSAEIAHFERERDRIRAFSTLESTRKAAAADEEKLSYYSSIEDQAAAVNFAIFQTIEKGKIQSLPIESFRNNPFSTAVVTAVGSRLLLDAYTSLRRSTGASEFGNEAALAAAIVCMRPIREIGDQTLSIEEILSANQLCAQFAIGKLLRINHGLDHAMLNPNDPLSFKSSYLETLLHLADQRIQNSTTVIAIPNLPDYEEYNAENDIQWGDVHYLERVMNAVAQLVNDS